jgi:NAD(P)-dependent dehydrogenase (short-subunit alcohol dehydrogenase family)
MAMVTGNELRAASQSCAGRVAVVTGGGRGLGRSYAMALAQAGACIVVNNDLRTDGADGAGASAAHAVAAEIRDRGGAAVASTEDISDWDGAGRLVNQAVDAFGRLDVLVNNAGNLRDRMIVNMTADDWDAVIRVHLRGTMGPLHWAAAFWRGQAKAGQEVCARVINTTSATGLYGKPGQANYGAAKAGVAALTVIAAAELGRYGVQVNAVSPVARTRMTSAGLPDAGQDAGQDRWQPERIAPFIVWLASPDSAGVTGRVFEVTGSAISIAEGWRRGPGAVNDEGWSAADLGPVVHGLLSAAQPNSDLQGVPGGIATAAVTIGGA